MGGGDLNMKKSWHPVLLVNQERVWKAEKQANEEKKALAQLRKEREEERQLAELQRLQEAATGRKRTERLDWMYSASGNEGGALGGARISETMMEDYLLGKRRVDEVLAASDKNVGNTHKDFVAVQNANTARDTAAKIREDPLLAIKRQEEAALRAMANRPDIRRQMKAMQKVGSSMGEESKEERKARKRAEKEERKRDRHERREKRRERDYSPRSDYSDERVDRRRSYDKEDRDRKRYRSDSRSVSPRRCRDDSPRRYKEEERSSRRYRDESPRRRDDSPRRRYDDREERRRSEGAREVYSGRNGSRDHDDRVPPPRDYSNGHANGRVNRHSNGHSNGPDSRHVHSHPSRPSASDMAERSAPRLPPPTNGSSLDEQRAARLAAMSRNAVDHDSQRTKNLALLEEKRRLEDEAEKRVRAKEGSKENASAAFYQQQSSMSLGESLSRRGGQGLQRNI